MRECGQQEQKSKVGCHTAVKLQQTLLVQFLSSNPVQAPSRYFTILPTPQENSKKMCRTPSDRDPVKRKVESPTAKRGRMDQKSQANIASASSVQAIHAQPKPKPTPSTKKQNTTQLTTITPTRAQPQTKTNAQQEVSSVPSCLLVRLVDKRI